MGFGMWWLIIALMIFLATRGCRRNRYGYVATDVRRAGDHEEVMELRQQIESQRGYIEELEGRLARVEDGLDFAERLLSQRPAGS
jgi:hypothetical protein